MAGAQHKDAAPASQDAFTPCDVQEGCTLPKWHTYLNGSPCCVPPTFTLSKRPRKDALAVARIMNAGEDWRAVLRLPADERLTENIIERALKAVRVEVHSDRCHAPGADDAFKRAGQARDALVEDLKKEKVEKVEKVAKGAAAKPKASAAAEAKPDEAKADDAKADAKSKRPRAVRTERVGSEMPLHSRVSSMDVGSAAPSKAGSAASADAPADVPAANRPAKRRRPPSAVPSADAPAAKRPAKRRSLPSAVPSAVPIAAASAAASPAADAPPTAPVGKKKHQKLINKCPICLVVAKSNGTARTGKYRFQCDNPDCAHRIESGQPKKFRAPPEYSEAAKLPLGAPWTKRARDDAEEAPAGQAAEEEAQAQAQAQAEAQAQAQEEAQAAAEAAAAAEAEAASSLTSTWRERMHRTPWRAPVGTLWRPFASFHLCHHETLTSEHGPLSALSCTLEGPRAEWVPSIWTGEVEEQARRDRDRDRGAALKTAPPPLSLHWFTEVPSGVHKVVAIECHRVPSSAIVCHPAPLSAFECH